MRFGSGENKISFFFLVWKFGSVYFVWWTKSCAGVILSSVEPDWL